MFTALTIDNQKIEASYKIIAFCGNCGHRVYPACVTPGKEYKKIKHFFHDKGVCCDEWYENISEWHLSWQSYVPINQREVSIDNGKDKHIADIYLDTINPPIAIELQKSNMPFDVKRKRDIFYNRIFWLVHKSLSQMQWVRESPTPIFIDLLDNTIKTPRGQIISKEDFINNILLNPSLKYEDWVYGFNGKEIITKFGKRMLNDIIQGEHLVFITTDHIISQCLLCKDHSEQRCNKESLIYINKNPYFQCNFCGRIYSAYLIKFDPRGDDDIRENKNDYAALRPFFGESKHMELFRKRQIVKRSVA